MSHIAHPYSLGEDGGWKVEDGDAMNRRLQSALRFQHFSILAFQHFSIPVRFHGPKSAWPNVATLLPLCCHFVAILLPFKCLIDNDVADVATFQTISTCKPDLKSLKINMVVGVFNGFLTISSLPTSNFSSVFPACRANSSRCSRAKAEATADQSHSR